MSIESFGEESEYYSRTHEKLALAGVTIEGTEFDGCTFKGCDFSQATFRKCKFVDCSFIGCNLSVIKVELSRFLDVSFDECKVAGVNWNQAAWPNLMFSSPLSFRKCVVSDSSFFGLNLSELVLEECKAIAVDFREGDFTEANFSYTNFSESLFGNTKLGGADFSEAENYDIDIHNNVLTRTKFSRHEAVRLLESLDIELVE